MSSEVNARTHCAFERHLHTASTGPTRPGSPEEAAAEDGVARLATNLLQKEKAALIHLPQDQCRMNSFLRIAAPARHSAYSATTTISTRRLLAFDPNGRSGPKLASEIRFPATFFAIKNLRTAYARSNPR